jgi:hypothetical protein
MPVNEKLGTVVRVTPQGTPGFIYSSLCLCVIAAKLFPLRHTCLDDFKHRFRHPGHVTICCHT